jgi:hypothetical protein
MGVPLLLLYNCLWMWSGWMFVLWTLLTVANVCLPSIWLRTVKCTMRSVGSPALWQCSCRTDGATVTSTSTHGGLEVFTASWSMCGCALWVRADQTPLNRSGYLMNKSKLSVRGVSFVCSFMYICSLWYLFVKLQAVHHYGKFMDPLWLLLIDLLSTIHIMETLSILLSVVAWNFVSHSISIYSTPNIQILERFQSRVLCMIVDAPWYVPNTFIRRVF